MTNVSDVTRLVMDRCQMLDNPSAKLGATWNIASDPGPTDQSPSSTEALAA